jgi:heme oxygenase
MRFKTPDDKPLKTDCINLFKQYIPLYQAMELRLDELAADNQNLTIFTKAPWTKRSQLLLDDVREMTSLLTEDEKQGLDETIKPAMTKLIEQIVHADALTLMACLTVRCLGDSFGGQALNKYNQQCFGDEHVLTGAFYNSAARKSQSQQSGMNLYRYIDTLDLSPEDNKLFLQQADTVFQAHLDLFKEMEEARTVPEAAPVAIKEQVEPKQGAGWGRYAFFGAAVVTGFTAAYQYCSSGQNNGSNPSSFQ